MHLLIVVCEYRITASKSNYFLKSEIWTSPSTSFSLSFPILHQSSLLLESSSQTNQSHFCTSLHFHCHCHSWHHGRSSFTMCYPTNWSLDIWTCSHFKPFSTQQSEWFWKANVIQSWLPLTEPSAAPINTPNGFNPFSNLFLHCLNILYFITIVRIAINLLYSSWSL